ncbi:INTS2 [Mytilus edulis]|uniref:INTS2 n=1 Tax=Mytilus edulis TaxID=6550 RepID=A0A8S3T2X0_MYTED|nr:INTS2 [Mytilus edulis]
MKLVTKVNGRKKKLLIIYLVFFPQKRQDPQASTLQALRHHLLEHLVSILPAGREPISDILQASSFIRLYCVLKGMGGLKFSDEEMRLLLRLVTSHPLQNKAGSRFVSLGLSMIMLCPYLLATVGDSYGEMLFLIAIHFHSNNTTAIGELVSSTLGMKAPVKGNALSRLRQIFTQEIFKEQVVTTHAVKVPVTPNLNGHMTGYLPINSVYQLLKTRSFSKYKVLIKDWIYRQICSSGCPLHNLLPSLIEVYVNSIIIKSTKTDHLNEPLSNQEVLDVYKSSVFGQSRGDNSFSQEDNSVSSQKGDNSVYNLTPQLIVLYYLLLYEDTVLNHMKIIGNYKLMVKRQESKDLPRWCSLSKIPINFLLQQAQKNQHQYPGLSSLLKKYHLTETTITPEQFQQDNNNTVNITENITPSQRQLSPWNSFNKEISPPKTTITLEQFPQAITVYHRKYHFTKVLNSFNKVTIQSISQVISLLTKTTITLEQFQQGKQYSQYQKYYSFTKTTITPGTVSLEISPRTKTFIPWKIFNRVITIQSISRNITLTKTTITLEQFQHVNTNTVNITGNITLTKTTITLEQFQQGNNNTVNITGNITLTKTTITLEQFQQAIDGLPLNIRNDEKLATTVIRLATVNALRQSNKRGAVITQYTENDVTIDPLIILRCDNRVYRCPPILEIILCILSAYMQASKVYLHNHTLVNPILDHASQTDQERRDLKNALIMAQDSAVVQILLECCLPKEDEGYPEELLNITVPGIPSMHICLDFVPELLSQPQMHKQIFAIKMMAHLCCQYALPKSLNIAKLAVNVMFTMVNVLGAGDKLEFFLETVPYLVKVCQAFPPLFEDVNSLLLQLGRVCVSQLSCNSNIIATEQTDLNFEPSKKKSRYSLLSPELTVQFEELHGLVRQTFSNIVKKSIVTRNIYS